MPESIEIIGFDVGHGESAVARVGLDGSSDPEMLGVNGEKRQISAIATHPTVGILIGKRAYLSPDVRTLTIGFKAKPRDDADYEDTLRNFVAAYARILREQHQLSDHATQNWLVGCPSGWAPPER